MGVKNAAGALLVAVAPLIAPAVADAARVSGAHYADGRPAFVPSTVSTLGDPQQAAVLNAATAATYLTSLYRGGHSASGPGGVEVAGVQVPGAASDWAQTVSTSGTPSQAALLNAATMIAAAYR